MEPQIESDELRPLRKLPFDLESLAELATEGEDDLGDEYARSGYVDTQTGEVHIIYRDAFRCADGELEPEEAEEWARDDVELAGKILEDTEGRYKEIERWHSSEEYDLMVEFAAATTHPGAKNALLQALSGRKPFRRFKDELCEWTGLRETWFLFQAHAHRDRARRWLRNFDIEAEDASAHKLGPRPERW